MPRHLLHRPTSQLVAYPRQDDQPVIGLDRSIYHVLQDVHDPRPDYDPAMHILSAAPPTIEITDPDGEDVNGTVNYGWTLTPIVPPPPPEPGPDWQGFAEWFYIYPPMVERMKVARDNIDPPGEPATSALFTAFDEARMRSNYSPLQGAWSLFVSASQMPAAEILPIAEKAIACHLPPEFVAALQPPQP